MQRSTIDLPRQHRRRRRRTAWLLFAITLLGLALRLWFVSDVNWPNPYDVASFRGDELGYHDFATQMFEGKFMEFPFRTPVYPMFLAAVYWAFGNSPAAAIAVQAFVGAAAIPLTYWLARLVTYRSAALIAALIIAVHYELISFSARLYTETLFTTLMVVMMIAFYRALRRDSIFRWAMAGIALGVLNLCRPVGGLLPIAIAIALPWRWPIARKVRGIALYGAMMFIPILPWMVHNYRQHGVIMVYSVSIATLWQGSPEFYHDIESGKSLLDIWHGGTLDPKANGGHSAHTIEGDKWFTERAKQSIKAEPGLWIRYCLQKAVHNWFGSPAIDWPFVYADKYSPGQVRGIISVRALVPLTGIALIWLAWHRRLRRYVPMMVVAIYFTAVHAVLYTEVRYSYPLHPFLAVMIGGALVEFVRCLRRPRAASFTASPAIN